MKVMRSMKQSKFIAILSMLAALMIALPVQAQTLEIRVPVVVNDKAMVRVTPENGAPAPVQDLIEVDKQADIVWQISEPGIYVYLVNQVAGSDQEIEYDQTEYEVIISVWYDGDAMLSSASICKKADDSKLELLAFDNVHRVPEPEDPPEDILKETLDEVIPPERDLPDDSFEKVVPPKPVDQPDDSPKKEMPPKPEVPPIPPKPVDMPDDSSKKVEPPKPVDLPKPPRPSNSGKMSASEVNEKHYLLFLSRAEAAQGVTKTIELDGQQIDIDVPAGSKGDTVIVIPGKGYRDKETGYCGDLRVELMIN